MLLFGLFFFFYQTSFGGIRVSICKTPTIVVQCLYDDDRAPGHDQDEMILLQRHELNVCLVANSCLVV